MYTPLWILLFSYRRQSELLKGSSINIQCIYNHIPLVFTINDVIVIVVVVVIVSLVVIFF